MDTRGIGRRLVLSGFMAALAALAAGCATPEPRIERHRPVLPGSTATMSVATTGSYGSGTTQVTTTVAERMWQGRKVTAQESAAGAMLLDPVDGTRLGYVGPNGQTQWTLTPSVGFRYPMEPGMTWIAESTLTIMGPQGSRAIPVHSVWKVHGVEDVTVPAGTFKAMRVNVLDTMGGQPWNDDTYWVEVTQEFSVKSLQKRLPTHPAGAGTREAVLVSNSIRR
jgi:hypothetical protein